MSATCRRNRGAGFTLLEILVVLAIAGLLVGVALPRLAGMAERVRVANQRQAIVDAIENLGYQAYSTGKQLRLDPPAETAQTLASLPPLPFDLPSGWRVRPLQQISYAINGMCSGGLIELQTPDDHAERYRLKPPLCRLEPVVPD